MAAINSIILGVVSLGFYGFSFYKYVKLKTLNMDYILIGNIFCLISVFIQLFNVNLFVRAMDTTYMLDIFTSSLDLALVFMVVVILINCFILFFRKDRH